MSLCGTGDTHCCWFKGQQCVYVTAVDNPPFKWACSLRLELGSWGKVHKDPRYILDVKPKVTDLGIVDCGDWKPEFACHDCGMGLD